MINSVTIIKWQSPTRILLFFLHSHGGLVCVHGVTSLGYSLDFKRQGAGRKRKK